MNEIAMVQIKAAEDYLSNKYLGICTIAKLKRKDLIRLRWLSWIVSEKLIII